MATVPTPDGGALISRPEMSAAALKAALAIVAPDQLPRMLEDEGKAVTETFRTDDTTHVRAFLMHWATVVEIERFPDRARAFHRAEYETHNAATVDECRENAQIVGEIWRSSFEAVVTWTWDWNPDRGHVAGGAPLPFLATDHPKAGARTRPLGEPQPLSPSS